MQNKSKVHTVYQQLLDLLFPQFCVGCNRRIPNTSGMPVCSRCLDTLNILPAPLCSGCGMPISQVAGRQIKVCRYCRKKAFAFDRCLSSYAYSGLMRTLVHELKFKRKTVLQPQLTRRLYNFLDNHLAWAEVDVVTSVPLHKTRRRERGFNQADLLGSSLAKITRRPYEHAMLRRLRPGRVQASLRAGPRSRNVAAVFSAGPARQLIKGKRILLIDDVITTGATAHACARILKENGAKSVTAASLARALPL